MRVGQSLLWNVRQQMPLGGRNNEPPYVPAGIYVMGDERLNLRDLFYADEDESGAFINNRITLSNYLCVLKHVVDCERTY